MQCLPKTAPKDLQKIGSISVAVRRSNALGLVTPQNREADASQSLTLREKEINKGGSLTHSTRSVYGCIWLVFQLLIAV